MSLLLCEGCKATLDREVATLGLGVEDANRVKRAALVAIIRFVDTRQRALPVDACHICTLKAGCTCGQGNACHYNTWAALAATAARDHLFGRAEA